ncbi:UNVERIFIED_ORG: restriction endonuclease subunit S [Shinella sp. XGS7]|nr:restriction endonuclease subunit S [Shinella sp. XGS7]
MTAAAKTVCKEANQGFPQGWDVCQLGELCTLITKGTTPTTLGFSYQASGINFIKVESIDGRGQINLEKAARISEAAHNALNRSKLQAGDVLYSIAGAIGRSAIVQNCHLPANTNQALAIIRPRDEIDTAYLRFVLSSETQLDHIAQISVSSAQANISLKDVSTFPVPLPPRPEQQKIAAILTAVDDKLDVIARQIEATQTLKQGLMRMLFSQGVGAQDADGRWVPHAEFKDTEQGRVPAAWSVQTLEQVAVVERGKFSARPRNDPKYFEGGDIPFVQTGDVAKSGRLISTASQFLNEAGLKVSKLFEPGTIFLTIAANIGDVAIAAIPMACPDSVVGIRAVEGACDPAWLYYLLSANKGYFDSRATQNAQKNINLQVLRPFRFAMPPPAEQAQIGLMLTALDEKLESLGRRLHHHQTLKRGLMQKLLTGEWRVKVDAERAA